MCNSYCFPTATVVTRTRPCLTRYRPSSSNIVHMIVRPVHKRHVPENAGTHGGPPPLPPGASSWFISIDIIQPQLHTCLCIKKGTLVHKDKRANVPTTATLCRQSDGRQQQSKVLPCFSGFYAALVFVHDIQQTAKDSSKCKPG